MDPGTPPETARDAGHALVDTATVGSDLVQRHGARLLIGFLCIALPLWGFGELGAEVREGVPLPFDVPILQAMHSMSGPVADRIFLAFSAIGFSGGVVPADVLLVAFLALRRMHRAATFAGVAVVGSALLNAAAKHVFHRARPALWISIAPETTYSFPSGHAMGSATLAAVVSVLVWRSRRRYPVLAAAVAFTLGVGLSRVYLGVHYPSDVLAGWAAALAWVLGCTRLLGPRQASVAPRSSPSYGSPNLP